MTEILTSAQMRAIERAAIESGVVTGRELMERAGAAIVTAALAEWPGLAVGAQRAAVLCGPGNNGGDGFVVARLLKARGWAVRVFLLGDPAHLPPDARDNHDRWQTLGPVAPMTPQALAVGVGVDLCVDAVFGIGLTRPVDDAIVAALTSFADAFLGGARVVSVDIASGLCADSGRVLGTRGAGLPGVLHADMTVTFHAPKVGHLLADAPRWCGKLVVADIGLAEFDRFATGPRALMARPDLDTLRKGDDRHPGAHKFDYGHALMLTGGMGRTGAARLAARAALRIGAGLVTLGAPGSAMLECACQISALMLRRIDTAAELDEALQDRRITALCLGPGLGIDRAADLLSVVVAQGGVEPHPTALVLDADALTALAPLVSPLPKQCVLTPHAGEFARLFPDLATRLKQPPLRGPSMSKLDAVREASTRSGCVVLYKGADTVIAAPDGRAAIHSAAYDHAAPWLATAGSGDVLAGMIAGLMARGADPFTASTTAAWLHGEAARAIGPGLISEDLPEVLPDVLRRILA